MSDLKRRPSRKTTPGYPAADEVMRQRREFLALVAKGALGVGVLGVFGCDAAKEPYELAGLLKAPDVVEDVEGEFPQLLGDMPAPDTCTLQDVEGEFPPLAGEPIMPDVVKLEDVEPEFPPLSGDEMMPDTIQAEDVEDEFPPLAGGIRMPDAVHTPDTE